RGRFPENRPGDGRGVPSRPRAVAPSDPECAMPGAEPGPRARPGSEDCRLGNEDCGAAPQASSRCNDHGRSDVAALTTMPGRQSDGPRHTPGTSGALPPAACI